jgi:hypothetical protein
MTQNVVEQLTRLAYERFTPTCFVRSWCFAYYCSLCRFGSYAWYKLAFGPEWTLFALGKWMLSCVCQFFWYL